MDERIGRFIKHVIDGLVVDENLKKRIALDLQSHIAEASTNQSTDEVLDKMGNPIEVAQEFMDSIYEDKSEVIERLIRERLKVNQLMNDYFEYKSRIVLFGLPLIHIKYRRHLKSKPGVAKGVIAIGNRAVGLLAIGRFAYGGICFGVFAVGVASAGIVSVGGVAFGGLSAGGLALGGFVFGLSAFGGFACGLIAGGGFTRGVVAMGGHMVGQYVGNPMSPDQIKTLIRQAYPHLADWILNILVWFKSLYT